jgi:hypothetical protein
MYITTTPQSVVLMLQTKARMNQMFIRLLVQILLSHLTMNLRRVAPKKNAGSKARHLLLPQDLQIPSHKPVHCGLSAGDMVGNNVVTLAVRTSLIASHAASDLTFNVLINCLRR